LLANSEVIRMGGEKMFEALDLDEILNEVETIDEEKEEESEEDEECEEEDSGRYYDGRKVVINNYYQNLEEERLGPVDRVYRDNMKVNRVMGSLYYNFLFRRTMRELAQDISDQTAKKVLRDIGRK
jgi:hypothetical protein